MQLGIYGEEAKDVLAADAATNDLVKLRGFRAHCGEGPHHTRRAARHGQVSVDLHGARCSSETKGQAVGRVPSRDHPRNEWLSARGQTRQGDRSAAKPLIQNLFTAPKEAVEPVLGMTLEIVSCVDEAQRNVLRREHE